MLADMHHNMQLCHNDFTKENLAVGFDQSDVFYTFGNQMIFGDFILIAKLNIDF